MPRSIAGVVAAGKATLRELDEYYSLEDVFGILEVVTVEGFNAQIVQKHQAKQHANR